MLNCDGAIGLMQHVNNPTRQRGGYTPHTLHLVITSEEFISDIKHLSPLGTSDHCLLIFTCQLHNTKFTSNKNKLRLDRGDYNDFREFLDIDWDDYLTPSDNSVDKMGENF